MGQTDGGECEGRLLLHCTKHAIPYMKAARRGSIINLSSIYPPFMDSLAQAISLRTTPPKARYGS
jgi:NAD(P)-dependent dehydrogenase (short-subunit alcohol dehydrogenase family)